MADAFSSVAGAVDSAGEGDSSCANVIAARKRDVKKGMMIFIELSWIGAASYEAAVEGEIVFGRSSDGQGLSKTVDRVEIVGRK